MSNEPVLIRSYLQPAADAAPMAILHKQKYSPKVQSGNMRQSGILRRGALPYASHDALLACVHDWSSEVLRS